MLRPSASRWSGLVALLFLLSTESVPGERVTPPFGSDEAWNWTDEQFSADLVLTHRHLELMEQWSGLWTRRGKWPLLYVAERVEKGVPVHAIVVFRGCHVSEAGTCAIKVDYVVLRPDGSEYGAVRGKALWEQNDPAPAPDLVYLGDSYVEFVADAEDPTGEYVFVATIYTAKNPEGIALKRSLWVTESE